MDDATLIQAALDSNDTGLMSLALKLVQHPLFAFKPRPDNDLLQDQQSSFYHSDHEGIICVLAGNAAGKSYVAAAKVASWLNKTPPPEKNTPYWVLSQTTEMVSSACWGQNLSKFIVPEQIAGYVWHNQIKNQPKSIILKPHANGNNWVIEFKSYDMGRQALQASNIAGWWCDEQAASEILREVDARYRKWFYKGNRIYTLTPLSPDPDPQNLEHIFNHQGDYPQYKFYRFNTRCNQVIDPGYVDKIKQNELDALVETRLTGAFARFMGSVYPNFDEHIHVCQPIELKPEWMHLRGIDVGWSHNTACVWAAKSTEGIYYIYREYFANQTSIEDHVKRIQDGWQQVRIKGPSYGDHAAQQVLHEFGIRGLPVLNAKKEVSAGIATVQSLLREPVRLKIFNTCSNLIAQMKNYTWDAKRLDKVLKVNDDLVDALRYCLHSHLVESQEKAVPMRKPQPVFKDMNRIKF